MYRHENTRLLTSPIAVRFSYYFLILSGVASLASLSYAQFVLGGQNPNFQSRQFFTAQAHSILRGQLSVADFRLPNECWISEGKCYGYFGIFPSIIRIPVLPLLPNNFLDLMFYFVPICLGIVYSIKIFLSIQQQTFSQFLVSRNRIAVKTALLFLVPGNFLLQLSKPQVFWEVISWSASLVLAGLYYFILWTRSSLNRHFLLSCLFFTCAANSRPNGAIIAFTLGIYLLIANRQYKTRLFSLFGFLGLSVPLFSCLFVYFLKFGQIIPNMYLQEIIPESSYWAKILENNGGSTVGLKFVATNAIGYLSPAAYAIRDNFPYISLRENYAFSFWPLPYGSMHVERHNSLLLIYPLFLFAFAATLKKAITNFIKSPKSSFKLNIEYVLIFSCLISLAPTLMIAAISNRYLGDFLPLVIIVFAIFFRDQVNQDLDSKSVIQGKWGLLLFFGIVGVLTNLYTLFLFSKNPLSLG